jgi:hypothetical protein
MNTPAAEVRLPMDKLVRMYRKMREKLLELDLEATNIKAQQAAVKAEIKDQLRAANLTSAKTAEGTVSLIQKTRYYTNDWDSFKEFCKEHDALDLFEKRIAQTNMKTYLEENPTLVPPGLNSETEFDVSIRKPS